MAGFENDVLVASNLNFDDAADPPHYAIITAAGMLPIGTGNLAPTPEILGGSLVSPNSTVTIGYVSPNITLQAGAAVATTYIEDSGVAVPSANILNIRGIIAAAGTNPLTTIGAANTVTIQTQYSVALAAADGTRVGLSNFDSARFTVGATGFVTLNAAGVGETITGDSGGALNPTAGNWNILGRSGSKTSGAASTLTINSPPFSQVGGSGTSVLNSGEFVTAAVTRTLPATAGLLDGDLVIYSCTTAGALVITANTGQTIRIGSLISSSAGTATSTAIGDSVSLRFDATAVVWRAVSVIGTWLIA